MDFNKKQKLQTLLFPEGILYDKENDRVRTFRVNTIFSVSRYVSENYDNKKSSSNS